MRRTKGLRIIFILLLLALAGRLYYIQISCSSDLSAIADSQQLIPVMQENGKGIIYDRNMNPLTGRECVYYYLIHKQNLTAGARQRLSCMHAEPAGQKGSDYLVYRTDRYPSEDSVILQKKYKAYGFSVRLRYGESQTAAPLLVDLDKMYERLLQTDDASFYLLGNAAGGLLQGSGISEAEPSADGDTGTSLITTLDVQMQEMAEDLLEKHRVTGCVVISDIRDGQVYAMASRDEGAMQNLAVERAYPLGKSYMLIKQISDMMKQKPEQAAAALGLGCFVFADYPKEDAGMIEGRKISATAAQMNQSLVALANQGAVLPLCILMQTLKADSIPCMEVTRTVAMKFDGLQKQLAERPITGDGWAIGYIGTYAVTIYLETGSAEEIYRQVAAQVPYARYDEK